MEGTARTIIEVPVSTKQKLLDICKERGITQKQFFIEAVEAEFERLGLQFNKQTK